MRSYLNAAEKADTLKLGAVTITLDEMIESWSNGKGNKSKVKWLRTARTYINKSFNALLAPLDPKEVEIVVKQASSMELVTMPVREAVRKRDKLRLEAGTQVLSWADFATLSSHALASCSVCESEGEEVNNCPFRILLMEQDVEALNLEAGPGTCQYRSKGFKNEGVSNG